MLSSNRFLMMVLVAITVAPLAAQTRTFKWSDDFCEYQGTFDAKKYSLEQLKNTALLREHSGFSIEASGTVFAQADIPKLDIAALDKEYADKTAWLTALKIVPTPYWEGVRRSKLAEMKQVYELSKITMQAYTRPTVLSGINGQDACKTKYADPLIAGGDQLKNAWRTLNIESRKKNSDPERIRRLFEEELASKDWQTFALVEMLTFGWWNCVNDSIKYVAYDGTQDREFKKLFIKVKKINCDAP